MNVITMPETAETIAIEVAAAAPVTSLMHDTQQIPLSKLVASSKKAQSARSCDFGQLAERCGNISCMIDRRRARS
jgi:hypothetical protein